jgi:hypothetical protein
MVLGLTKTLVLHPRHKLAYFKTQQWEADWIATAEELVRTQFNRCYASGTKCIDVAASAGDETTAQVCTYLFSFFFRLTMSIILWSGIFRQHL